jgi:hypothetical protein
MPSTMNNYRFLRLGHTCLSFRLLQPKPHVHLAVQRRRDGEVFVRLLALAGAPVPARLGKRQRLAVVGLAALGIESVGMGRDIAEQV